MNIGTSRLILEPVTEKHILGIFNHFTSEITVYMFPSPAKDMSEIKNIVGCWIRQRAAKTDYVYAIMLKETDEFLGVVGLHDLNSEMPELGIWTKIDAHGNHYGREAIGGLIEYAKELGYIKLMYPVDKKNIASKKIPLFYGGEVIVENKLVRTPDGRTLDEEVYKITL